MLKAFRLTFVLCFVVLAASCALKPTWDVIGKWQVVDGKEIVEFQRNGMVSVVAADGGVVTVPFKFVNSKTLEIEVGGLGSITATIVMGKNELTITDGAGKTTKYHKVK